MGSEYGLGELGSGLEWLIVVLPETVPQKGGWGSARPRRGVSMGRYKWLYSLENLLPVHQHL